MGAIENDLKISHSDAGTCMYCSSFNISSIIEMMYKYHTVMQVHACMAAVSIYHLLRASATVGASWTACLNVTHRGIYVRKKYIPFI